MKHLQVQPEEWEQLPLFCDDILREGRVLALPVGERTVNPEFVKRWRIPPSKRRVLELLVLNHSNTQIAAELGIKRGSVEQYISSIIDMTASLGIENRADLVYYATKPTESPDSQTIRRLNVS